VHFLRLLAFLLEVAGGFVNLSKRGLKELAVVAYIGAIDIALPAVQEAPGIGFGIPYGAGGKDAPRESKGGRIKFEDREIGELVAPRIEELVVEDAVGLAGTRLAIDPVLLRVQDGLRRL